MDTIRVRRWKIIGHTLRNPKELHNIIIERKIKKTIGMIS